MKGFQGIILFTFAISAFCSTTVEQKQVTLSEENKVIEYKTLIADKKEAFVCVILSKVGKVEDKAMVELFTAKYAEADKEASAKVAVTKTTGAGENNAQTVAEPTKTEDTGKNQPATNEKKEADGKAGADDKKDGRILAEGETKAPENPATPATPTTPQVPTTNKTEKIQTPHTIYIECQMPKANSQVEKKTFKGVCNTSKIDFAYKASYLTEEVTTSMPFSEKSEMFISVADAYPYRENKNVIGFTDNNCRLSVSSAKIMGIVLGIAMLIVNLL